MHKNDVSPRPPMGFNTWDCYGAAVNEEQLLGNAEYVRDKLKAYGWEYVVCDIQWYEPTADSYAYHPFADLCMDEYSRLIPAPNRFPSAADGRGFGPIADRIHGMGLKFGIHIMRGIPRQAVHRNTPTVTPGVTARMLAQPYSLCPWNTDMYGVDPDAPGAQAYYDSLFVLYAEWGVDFVKVDDIANTEYKPHDPYSARREIEMIRRAIDGCGREMVLSLSPGPAPLDHADHLRENANMWRMSGDFWDDSAALDRMFDLCFRWNPFRSPGCWPDCDMLPLGTLQLTEKDPVYRARKTRFTPDEQIMLMNLWCVFRSPLFFGGELRMNDDFTLSLITNRDVLELDRNSSFNRPLLWDGKRAVWTCLDGEGRRVYALFHLGAPGDKPVSLSVSTEGKTVRDLWSGEAFPAAETFPVTLSPRTSRMLRLED